MRERRSSDGVEPSVAPGVAAKQAPRGEQGAADQALRAQRIDRVVRAGGLVLAGRREERPEGRAPEPDRNNAQSVHQAAATFVMSSTSSTRSASHSKPFAVTASGRPARTIST